MGQDRNCRTWVALIMIFFFFFPCGEQGFGLCTATWKSTPAGDWRWPGLSRMGSVPIKNCLLRPPIFPNVNFVFQLSCFLLFPSNSCYYFIIFCIFSLMSAGQGWRRVFHCFRHIMMVLRRVFSMPTWKRKVGFLKFVIRLVTLIQLLKEATIFVSSVFCSFRYV